MDLASTGAYIDLGGEDPSARFEAHPALVAFLRQDTELFRIDTRTDIQPWWQPNTALLQRVQDVGGVVNPLELTDYRRYWEDVGGRSSRLYDLLNVKYVIVSRQSPMDAAKFEVAFAQDPDLVVYRNRHYLPRAFLVPQAIPADHEAAWAMIHEPDFDPSRVVIVEGGPALDGQPDQPGHVEITRYAPNQIELAVRSPSEAYLLLSEVFYPGWRAEIDGVQTSLYRADGIFRALRVPAGDHQVVLAFSPRSWWIGLTTSLIAGIGLLVAAIAGLVRHRQNRARQSLPR